MRERLVRERRSKRASSDCTEYHSRNNGCGHGSGLPVPSGDICNFIESLEVVVVGGREVRARLYIRPVVKVEVRDR